MSLIDNKKVMLRFEPLETYSAGLELTGGEAKSLRNKKGSLDGSRVVVRGGEAYLVGMTIPPFQVSNTPDTYDPERPRKLLLSKKEIQELFAAESQKGLTIVPIDVYNKGTYLKVRIAIVRGKNKADRREDLKRKDAQLEVARVLKRKV